MTHLAIDSPPPPRPPKTAHARAGASSIGLLATLVGCLGEPAPIDSSAGDTSSSTAGDTGSESGGPGESGSGPSSLDASGDGDTTSGPLDGDSTGPSAEDGSSGEPPACTLSGQWELVDEHIDETGVGSAAGGVSSDGRGTVLVVGGYADRWVVRATADGGASWDVIDDFPQGGFTGAGAADIAVAPDGTVFVVGNASSGVGVPGSSRLVRRADSAASAEWTTVDEFLYEPGFPTYAGSIAVGSDGTILAVGQAESSTSNHWVIRESVDGGDSWQTTSDFQLVAGNTCLPADVGFSADATAYVAGRCLDEQMQMHWVVRRRPSAGDWATVDDFVAAPGGTASAARLFIGEALLVTGRGNDGGSDRLIVRSSPDGETWSTLGEYLSRAGGISGSGIYDDGRGTLIAIATEAGVLPTVVTLRSTDGGVRWASIDAFTYEAGAYMGGLHRDEDGALWSAGIGLVDGEANRWIVRRMACE